jgi:hypothetical protein
MSWLADNANYVYILLGLVALGFLSAGWITRRVKFFALAGIPIGIMVLFWLLTRLVVTDQQQLQTAVDEMASAAIKGDAAGLFKHVSRDFRHKQMTREQLAGFIKNAVTAHKITEVKIREFEVVEVSRATRSAKVNFRASIFDKDSVLALTFCIGDFVLEDDQWKLKAIDFRNAANPDQPMQGAP